MRHNALFAIVWIFVLLITTIACSKFEDGPNISFRKITNRMVGKYRIVYFSKNEVDITSFWVQNYDLIFSIYKQDMGSSDFLGYTVNGNIICDDTIKRYQYVDYFEVFIHDNVTVKMRNYFRDSLQYPDRLLYPVFTLPNQVRPIFTVSRLTNDEMWLEHEIGYDRYEIHFKE